jgi:hypothetical protein
MKTQHSIWHCLSNHSHFQPVWATPHKNKPEYSNFNLGTNWWHSLNQALLSCLRLFNIDPQRLKYDQSFRSERISLRATSANVSWRDWNERDKDMNVGA